MPKYELTKKENAFLTLEIEGKDYNIPLISTLKMKEVKRLLKVINSDESDQIEGIAAFLGDYMGEEIVDDMTIKDIKEVFDIWKEANDKEGGPALGES